MYNPLLTISDEGRLMLSTLTNMPGYDVPARLKDELMQTGLLMQGSFWLQPTKKFYAHVRRLWRSGCIISDTGAIESFK